MNKLCFLTSCLTNLLLNIYTKSCYPIIYNEKVSFLTIQADDNQPQKTPLGPQGGLHTMLFAAFGECDHRRMVMKCYAISSYTIIYNENLCFLL